ncbi:MAG: energy transducer TonB [Betaproteobacteria bacterium]|nr:energy transducer TonB [Betaproteobacteria bacterium]
MIFDDAPAKRLATALGLSVCVHLLLLFWTHHRSPVSAGHGQTSANVPTTLEATLAPPSPPLAAVTPQSPAPPLVPAHRTIAKPPRRLAPHRRRRSASTPSAHRTVHAGSPERMRRRAGVAPFHSVPGESASRPAAPADLAAASLAMAQALGANDGFDARTRIIEPSPRDYALEQYEASWVQKVERIGNLNYPAEAKRLHLYGSLRVAVFIRADGSLARIEIEQPSGSEVLDRAAIRIAKLAAPYAPLPPKYAEQHSILRISRVWSFVEGDQFYEQ